MIYGAPRVPSLKLSNPFRRGADRPSLKERAASLKATAARGMTRKPADPVFAAIERYAAARAAGDAYSDRIQTEGCDALGGFLAANDEDARLGRIWFSLAMEVLATVPTTEAGRLALAAFVEAWVDDSGNLDGSPQDGAETVFAEVYPALLRALRASVTV